MAERGGPVLVTDPHYVDHCATWLPPAIAGALVVAGIALIIWGLSGA